MRNLLRSHTSVGRVGTKLTAVVMALGLLLMFTASAFANTVNVYDNAHVLNSSQVRSEASSLSYPLDIYTITNYTSGNSAFDQSTANKINKSNLIVMAINTTQGNRHVRVDGGRSVSLSNSDYQNAATAFASSYNNGDYTGAAVAAIRSLRAAAGQSGGGGALPNAGGIGNAFGTTALCCIGILVVAGLAFFVIMRRRNRPGGMGGFFNRNRPVQPPYDPNYNQQQYGNQYNQQQYPPNYSGNRPGMNPWAAGGLGAAAGGLLGYELGKQEGEEDRGGNNNGGDNNGGGNFGGGGGADFGNDNNGGGGDFGGGGGADFGGGGDSGGGGGGGDF